MISRWTSLWTLAILKRIAVALERANELKEAETPPKPRRSKIVDFGVADPEEWSKRWRDEQVALGRDPG